MSSESKYKELGDMFKKIYSDTPDTDKLDILWNKIKVNAPTYHKEPPEYVNGMRIYKTNWLIRIILFWKKKEWVAWDSEKNQHLLIKSILGKHFFYEFAFYGYYGPIKLI